MKLENKVREQAKTITMFQSKHADYGRQLCWWAKFKDIFCKTYGSVAYMDLVEIISTGKFAGSCWLGEGAGKCDVCKKEVERIYWSKNRKHKYCSSTCLLHLIGVV